MALEISFGKLGTSGKLGQQLTTRGNYLRAPAVVQRYGEQQPRAVSGLAASAVYLSHNNGLKPYLAADGLEPDVVLLQSIELFAKKLFQESHQGIDFKPRAFPVLGGKGIEGQIVDAEPGGGFDGCANRLRAGAMPGDPRLITASGPAAVAVHYDRHVGRQPVEVYLSQKKLVS